MFLPFSNHGYRWWKNSRAIAGLVTRTFLVRFTVEHNMRREAIRLPLADQSPGEAQSELFTLLVERKIC